MGISIELQKFERKRVVCYLSRYSLVFSYNRYKNVPNFQFDVSLKTIRENGKEVQFSVFLSWLAKMKGWSKVEADCRVYFHLLEHVIQQEVEPMFRHKGLFADHYNWEQEFKILVLPNKCFQEDVMGKLEEFNQFLQAKRKFV